MINEVSIQYAKSLFELTESVDDKRIDLENLKVLSEALLTNDVIKVMNHPLITNNAKKELIDNLIKEKVTTNFLYFIYVLIDNDRLMELANIREAYEALLNDCLNELCVKVVSKNELSKENEANLIDMLTKKYQKTIKLTKEIDSSLAGGIKVFVGNEIIDCSFDNMLLNLKNTLKG